MIEFKGTTPLNFKRQSSLDQGYYYAAKRDSTIPWWAWIAAAVFLIYWFGLFYFASLLGF